MILNLSKFERDVQSKISSLRLGKKKDYDYSYFYLWFYQRP